MHSITFTHAIFRSRPPRQASPRGRRLLSWPQCARSVTHAACATYEQRAGVPTVLRRAARAGSPIVVLNMIPVAAPSFHSEPAAALDGCSALVARARSCSYCARRCCGAWTSPIATASCTCHERNVLRNLLGPVHCMRAANSQLCGQLAHLRCVILQPNPGAPRTALTCACRRCRAPALCSTRY